jgi:hypothetical protein
MSTPSSPSPMHGPELRRRPALLDERSRPDFRTTYGLLVEESLRVDVAIRKIRLSGMSLAPRELEAPRRIRVLMAEINILTLASEAEIMAAASDGRRRVAMLGELLQADILRIRSAPLGGWSPDFSVFRLREGGTRLLVGPHWFARPYPHRGPALASLHTGRDAARIARRFESIWEGAHPVDGPVRRVLSEAMERVPAAEEPAMPDSREGPRRGARNAAS